MMARIAIDIWRIPVVDSDALVGCFLSVVMMQHFSYFRAVWSEWIGRNLQEGLDNLSPGCAP
jgi:hypothetical protein